MLLDFLAYAVIPVYTILFAGKTDWISANFSIIRNFGLRKTAFVLWGMILVFYFYISMRDIVNSSVSNRAEQLLSRASLCLLIFTVLTPYRPEEFPFFSSLHVWFAFSCPAVLMLCLLVILLRCRKRNPRLYLPYLFGFWGIVSASFAFYLSAGMINSALEVFFVISCSLLVRRIHRRVADQA
ncbi:hypothetical protein AALB16_01020 [Lachnospiraceae bacterium 62-35]